MDLQPQKAGVWPVKGKMRPEKRWRGRG